MGQRKLWVSILVLVLMLASISFVQVTCLQVRTAISGNRDTQGIRIKEAGSAFGNRAKVLTAVEDSERLVPTGPDPLHHRNNPIKP